MIKVDSLSKRYGETTAVADVSFTCEPGTITGFLGPNGAGKSTTMRMICGLTRPSSGSATIMGVPYGHIANPGRHVGVMLDAAAMHPGRTGRETLALTAQLLGVDRSRVDDMFERVGLSSRAARRRVGAYSLGMRQRLGIAQALIGDPDALILDEPANGLDPEGIFWMRGLLRDFADGGGAVLLSSHLLHEVEEVADHYVVISGGRVVARGGKDELLTRQHAGAVVRAEDPAALRAALAAAGLDARPREDGSLHVQASGLEVGRAAAEASVVLVELREESGSLEKLFLSLTSGDRPEAPAAPEPVTEEVR